MGHKEMGWAGVGRIVCKLIRELNVHILRLEDTQFTFLQQLASANDKYKDCTSISAVISGHLALGKHLFGKGIGVSKQILCENPFMFEYT